MGLCRSSSTGRHNIFGSTPQRRRSWACCRVACSRTGDAGPPPGLRLPSTEKSARRREPIEAISGGAEGVWTAFVPPRHFRPGANEVDGLRHPRRARRRPARARLRLEQASRDGEPGVTRRTRLLVGAADWLLTRGKGARIPTSGRTATRRSSSLAIGGPSPNRCEWESRSRAPAHR